MPKKDIGIDLGTANVLIYVEGQGIVLNEPSVVAFDANTNQVVAIGQEAFDMIGRVPGDYRIVRPMRDGVISDFDVTETMLTYFVNKLNVKGLMSKPNIMICAPTSITEIERNAIIQVAERAGGAKVFVEYEPKVAAFDAGLDIFAPVGNMVIDIGGGTTDIAVISMGDIVVGDSIKVAGDTMTADIVNYLKREAGILIGDSTAEQIKRKIGSVVQTPNPETIELRGANLVDNMPVSFTMSSNDVELALRDSINKIVDATIEVFSKLPPELSADIINRGILLTGGGALLNGLAQSLTQRLKVPVILSEAPLINVARGAGLLLKRMNTNGRYDPKIQNQPTPQEITIAHQRYIQNQNELNQTQIPIVSENRSPNNLNN